MEDVLAIDTMCRPTYVRPELAKSVAETYEFEVLATTTFGGVAERLGLGPDEAWKAITATSNDSIEETVTEMDEVGVEYVFLDQMIQWSRRESRPLVGAATDDLVELREAADGRFVLGAGYNPHRIQESLARIERAVTEHGFEYVWFHPASFGLSPTDQKCYPLYSKCVELEVPVAYQTGQSAEPLPSDPGRPMVAEEVAMDFPELTLVLTHAGWPWTREWCSMLWRFPNVYGNVGGYFPSFLPDELVEFVDSGRISEKVFWGTNGLGLERCKEEFLDLGVSEKTTRRVLRENALEVFDLN